MIKFFRHIRLTQQNFAFAKSNVLWTFGGDSRLRKN